MEGIRALNVKGDLKGMTVIDTTTGNRIGRVADALIDPVKGRVSGIVVDSDEGRHTPLGAREFRLGPDAIMAVDSFDRGATDGLDGLAIPATDGIVGTNMVTEDGRLIGKVSDVYVSGDTPRVVYHVTGSTIQSIFGGGFYLAADAVSAYSDDGTRMIVPADTPERLAGSTLYEALERHIP